VSPVEHWQIGPSWPKAENPFCTFMVQFNKACAACLRAQQQTCNDPKTCEAHTVMCFAGLCETSVPLRLGENLVGFLKTGGVLFNRPP
jgi:ligand-binding sensor protein